MSDLDLLVTGTSAPPVLPVRESAGQMSLEIEPETGAIRHVAWRGVEFMRMIYANVRKSNWSTISPKVSNFEVDHTGDGFRATFDAEHVDGEYDFVWKGTIKADGRGHLTYTLDGEARKGFKTNRTGICVLHPAQLRNTRCEIGHPQGACETSRFPDLIDPNTPFTDVVSVTCEPYAGATATITFEGELFEMEDQRNFGDNSFKTYVYPQTHPTPERPMPYEIKAGQKVRQVVKITVRGELPKNTPPFDLSAASTPAFCTPVLGTVVEVAGEGTRDEMAGLGFSRAIVRDAKTNPGVPTILLADDPKAAGDGAFALTNPSRSAQLEGVKARPRLASSTGVFGDLNRNRPAPNHIEGAMWGHQPQIHLVDTRTLFESPLTFADEVRTARSFVEGEAILGPVTMAGGREDARWNSLAGLAWVLTVYAQASRACPDALILESLGRFKGTLPRLALEDLAGYEVAGFEGTRDFIITAIHLRKASKGRTLVANQTPEEQLLKLREMGPTAKARVLDAANVAAVAADLTIWHRQEPSAVPPRLRAHAYIAIDFDL